MLKAQLEKEKVGELDLIDEKVKYCQNCLKIYQQLISTGKLCVFESANERPDMIKVFQMLVN